MFSVLCVRNGSSLAVLGSGSSSMSDSWIAWNPRIDEPSNIRPSVKTSSLNADAGTVKCCIVPGRSQNLTSMNSTFSSAMKLSTSSELLNINPPGTGQAFSVSRHAIRTLDVGNFRAVSGVFHECYGLDVQGQDPLWPAARPVARNGYRGVVAKKSPLTASPVTDKTPYYPGQRFGLPAQGPGSVATMGRRVLALLIDWLLSMLIAYWLTHSQFWTILVFAVEVFMLTALTGSTVGKRLLGIRVIRTNGGRGGFGRSLVRAPVPLAGVAPLLSVRDMRGLHDRAADTIV